MEKTVGFLRSEWEELKEQMCDEYCCWPTASPTQERLNKHCEECPLNKIERSGKDGKN